MTESRATWTQDAADDLKAPSIGAIVRWASRAAQAKAAVGICDRTLTHLLGKQRDVSLSMLALSPGGLREAVEAHVDTGSVMDAERALADAIEAEEFATRISRALEIRRTRIAADEAKAALQVVKGGKR